MNHREAIESSAAERYLLDEMSEEERHLFEEHFFACAECADEVRTGSVMRSGVKAGLMGAADVRRVERPAKRRPFLGPTSTLLPWAAAAALALVAGYQSFVVVPGLRRALEPQGLAPVTLRPPSRGAEPVVRIGRGTSGAAGGTVATLAIDVVAPGGAMLTYDLRTSNGQRVATGAVAAPPPGSPLLLLVPAAIMSADEHYVLAIKAADGQLLDEYRFSVINE
jgi:hypothetical protein